MTLLEIMDKIDINYYQAVASLFLAIITISYKFYLWIKIIRKKDILKPLEINKSDMFDNITKSFLIDQCSIREFSKMGYGEMSVKSRNYLIRLHYKSNGAFGVKDVKNLSNHVFYDFENKPYIGFSNLKTLFSVLTYVATTVYASFLGYEIFLALHEFEIGSMSFWFLLIIISLSLFMAFIFFLKFVGFMFSYIQYTIYR